MGKVILLRPHLRMGIENILLIRYCHFLINHLNFKIMSKHILSPGKIAKLFSLALFILIIACNDKKEDANGNSDARADSTEKVMAALGDLPALCISKQEFID